MSDDLKPNKVELQYCIMGYSHDDYIFLFFMVRLDCEFNKL